MNIKGHTLFCVHLSVTQLMQQNAFWSPAPRSWHCLTSDPFFPPCCGFRRWDMSWWPAERAGLLYPWPPGTAPFKLTFPSPLTSFFLLCYSLTIISLNHTTLPLQMVFFHMIQLLKSAFYVVFEYFTRPYRLGRWATGWDGSKGIIKMGVGG